MNWLVLKYVLDCYRSQWRINVLNLNALTNRTTPLSPGTDLHEASQFCCSPFSWRKCHENVSLKYKYVALKWYPQIYCCLLNLLQENYHRWTSSRFLYLNIKQNKKTTEKKAWDQHVFLILSDQRNFEF